MTNVTSHIGYVKKQKQKTFVIFFQLNYYITKLQSAEEKMDTELRRKSSACNLEDSPIR